MPAMEDGTHRAQWFDDTSHRTAAQRIVAIEDGRQGQAGEDAAHQPEGRAGVPAIEEAIAGRGQRVGAARDDAVADGRAVALDAIDRRAEGRDDRRGRADVGTVAGARDPALAVGQGGQHQRAMADGLVAGQPQLPAQARAGTDARDLGLGHRHDPPDPWAAVGGVDAADEGVERRDGGHHVAELVEGQLLLGVRQCLVGVRVDLDHDPVGPDRDAAEGERLDQPALAGGVARVDDDRQVGQPVEERHRGEIHRVPGVRLERPDAALAQDHVGIPGADDVLGGHQEFLDGRAVAALEHHRAARPARRRAAASSSACCGCRSGGCRRTRRRCRPGSAP